MNYLELLKGKKTFIIIGIMVVLGSLQGLDIVTVPDQVYELLGLIGLGFFKAGVNRVSQEVKDLKEQVENGKDS